MAVLNGLAVEITRWMACHGGRAPETWTIQDRDVPELARQMAALRSTRFHLHGPVFDTPPPAEIIEVELRAGRVMVRGVEIRVQGAPSEAAMGALSELG